MRGSFDDFADEIVRQGRKMPEFAIGERVKRATWRNGSYTPEFLIYSGNFTYRNNDKSHKRKRKLFHSS